MAAFRVEKINNYEQQLLIHKAVRSGEIPTIKALSAEYSELLAQKQRDYAAYREARDQMRELLTVKANVDRVTEREPDQQKEQSQHR